MPGRIVQYPLEIVDAAQKITQSATALNTLMADLTRDKNALEAVSGGAAAVAFSEVHNAWNNSGLANNARFQAVAKVADESQLRMTEFDRYMANRFRG
jgi:uncharacterized protein YukE